MMLKKVFICVYADFPRGDAPANYVEYIGKAIQSEKIEVYVIGVTGDRKDCSQWFWYHNMKCCNVYYNVSNSLHTLEARLRVGFDMWNKIKEQRISDGDVIITYSGNYFLLKTFWLKSIFHKIKVIHCIADWHMANKYKYGHLDVFNYWYYCLGFYRGIGCNKNVIPISKKLEKYFQKKGCNTFIIPPLTDPYEFQYNEKKNSDKIRLIYSGKYLAKDSMEVMLLAIARLKEEELERIEFHIAGGATKQLDITIKEIKEDNWRKIADNVILHEWMPYEDLIKLYNQMHFVLIARQNNRTTQSNFPSKIPEMMSYGIIPIMNRVGDCPKYYLEDGKDSILFDQCDVVECQQAISRAIALMPEQRKNMQDCARKKAETVFYYKEWGEKIREFISD